MTASNLTWQRVAPRIGTSEVRSITDLERSTIDLYAASMQHADASRSATKLGDPRRSDGQKALRVAALAFAGQLLRAMRMKGEESDLRDQAVDMIRQLAQAEQEDA